MCLYPKLIKNKKYTANKKNNGKIPTCKDVRTQWVPVGCGQCVECRNQKKREWQIRLNEEIMENKGQFITLTFNNEQLEKLIKITNGKESNAVATIAVRRFLERWRKKYKKSVKHWLITELGHNGTERIHLHGILFTNEDKETIEELWKYGNIWIGEYCNEKTINYIIKYVTKIDEQHIGYKPIILTSPGIGKKYVEREDSKKNKYKENETNEAYRLKSGRRSSLPIYYRNKLYTEEERERLWIEKLDKQERYVRGVKIKIDTEEGIQEYEKIVDKAREVNKRLGYGDDTSKYKKKEYNVTLRDININRRYNNKEIVK